ncbi:MAG: histidine phosphatase family protein [Spirochaetales bacterium]|nr:histidine phosphatase family protein [Spirochaetales bacterium]
MRVYIIRHGQSAANVTGARNGQGDVPLTQRGKEEALGLRLKLSGISFDRIYSSDLIRAIDTCKTAIPESDPIRIKDLREIDVGGLAGKTNEECLKLFGPEYSLNLADFNFAPYGGENLEKVFERVARFMHLLESLPEDFAIAVFAHYGSIVSILRYVLGSMIDRNRFSIGNCSIIEAEFRNGFWKLIRMEV